MTPALAEILREAVKRQASDVHLLVGYPPAFRVHGAMELSAAPAIDANALVQMLEGSVPGDQWQLFRKTRRLCVSLNIAGLGFFRVTLYSHLGRAEAAIRIGSRRIPSLQDLGIPDVVLDLLRRPFGLLLVTGPTGVGKTTTMNSLLARVNAEDRKKIITVEDPVEFVHRQEKSLIVQQEIGLDMPDFATAVVHALRQDPDIIAIGEMRDLPAIGAGLTAAETGHVVMATLHTTTADGTVTRLVDVFPGEQQQQARVQLAGVLAGVLCQRLLPRADGKGRILVYELMVANDAARNIIREGKNHLLRNVIQTGQQLGMRAMDTMVKDAYDAGEITYDTALSALNDKRVLGK